LAWLTEIFGVDLLVSFPPSSASTTTPGTLPTPIVTLLEFNASPDFQQSGNRLQGELLGMFQGVVRGVVGPFFGMPTRNQRDEDEDEDGDEGERSGTAERGREDEAWSLGEERWGWRKIGQGAVRGPTV
jgi:hypothetical protein